MSSNTSCRIPPTPDDNALPQSNKRRCSAERPTLTGPSEASNELATGRRILKKNSPQMTPHDDGGTVKLTRTGRVSKATKGQRIHHCDECGRTYTRAEHLRRHQQNHKAGAFPCDLPGCSRSFYREDLLTRHQLRHDDPFRSPSRQASPDSEGSGPPGPLLVQTIPGRAAAAHEVSVANLDDGNLDAPSRSTRAGGHQDSDTRIKDRYLNLHDLRQRTNQAIPTESGSWPDLRFGVLQYWNPSPPSSPTGYDSPGHDGFNHSSLPYFQAQPNQVYHHSNTPFYDTRAVPAASRSPVSEGSSTIHLPQWGRGMHSASYPRMSAPTSSDGLYGGDFGLYSDHMSGPQVLLSNYGSGAWTPDDRDFMEQEELVVPMTTSRSSSLDLSFDDLAVSSEDNYLQAYWTWVHPFFAVMHQPSFNIHTASPLLKAAILALGAQACDSSPDKRTGRIIHERCVKVLQKRTLNDWHSFRVCDMQAIVLIEIYSVYKSRRPPFQFSSIFTQVYKHLANNHMAMDVHTSGGLSGNEFDIHVRGFDSISSALTIDASCKRRLLMACYILDVEHAILFGRRRTNCISGSGVDLPFPEPQAVWDGTLRQHLTGDVTHNTVSDAFNGIRSDSDGCDIFQSTLMMVSVTDSYSDASGMPIVCTAAADEACESMFSHMEQSPRSRMTYHTGKLCKITPIRALLAVAGESWVMGEKLSAQSDFAKAQALIREWAEAGTGDAQNEPINQALRHAMKILELYQTQQKTGLLFQEWAIYLASVVLWARAYATSGGPQKMPRLSIPQPTEPRMSMLELDKAVTAIVAAGWSESISKDQAKTVLLWTKAKIERVNVPHNCGLTNGALDVLGKLITRGKEDGWFCS